eukprot:2947072-Pyramimonas_sp.AAC.1
MAATIQRLGLPADKLARGRTEGETTCEFVKQGEIRPEAGQDVNFWTAWSQQSNWPNGRREDRYGLTGTAGRVIIACPAPLAQGSRDLCILSGGRPTALESDNA